MGRSLTVIATVLNHIVTTMHINRQPKMRCSGQGWLPSALLITTLLITAIAPSAHAIVGRDWTTRNPLPTGEVITSVVSNGSRLVAVGGHGLVATSDDGTTWTLQTSGVTANLSSVAWSPGGAKFMAVGANSTAITSPDGITWTSKNALGTDNLTSVAWTGNVFVAVGTNGAIGAAQTTTDGTTWTRSTPGAEPVLQVVAASSANLFAITTKSILGGTFGAKGLVWTKVTGLTGISATDLPKSLVWSGTNLVLCTVNGGLPSFWTSTNAKTWAAPTTAPTAISPLRLSKAGTEVIGVGQAGDVWTSINGTSWTQRATGQNVELLGGAKLGSTLVVTGQGGRIYSGNDTGMTVWTSRLSTGVVTDVAGVTSNGFGFLGVGLDFSLTSSDGITWTNRPQTSKNMRSVTYTGTQYIAVGDGAWTSPDGITWTETLPSANAGILTRVIWTGSQAVAVGLDTATGRSQVLTSPDGAAWTQATMPALSTKKLNGVGSFGGLLAAVGEGGLVVVSPDFGANWSKVTVVLKAGEHFTDAVFGNNLFVAVTNLGGIWTSASGTKWVNRKAASSGSLNRIIRAGNQFVAIGDQGKEAYSFGGIEWVVAPTSISSQNLRDLAWTGTILGTVGTAGAILTSDGAQPTRPTVTFSLASNAVAEGIGTSAPVLTVNLAPAPSLPVTVLFSLGGTASQGTATTSDYSLSTLPLKFTPGGPTSLSIPITIKQDVLDEVNETAVLTLGAPTGDATLGAPFVHTLTINDDDQVPTFVAQPNHLLVNTGSTPAFSAAVAASGTPGTVLTALWKKNNAAAAGLVTSTTPTAVPVGSIFGATIASAALTHAGAYTVTVKNPSGSATSGIAQLGVVDNTLQALNVAADSTATLTVKAAGNGLTYQWLKNGVPLSNSADLRITGTTTTKLVIKEMSFADNATYACEVTQSTTTGKNTILGASTLLSVVVAAPVITDTALPSTVVGQPYDYTVAANGTPNKWTVQNLPTGLTFNTISGRITGKVNMPVTSGTDFTNIIFTATNIVGTGPAKTLSLHVDPLPANALGSYTGTLERKAPLNAAFNDASQIGLGGRVQLTIASSGSYTGSVDQGSVSYPLLGVVTYVPAGPLVQISTVLSGNGLPTSTLTLTINPTTRAITGNTNNAPGGTDVAVFTGWRSNLWTESPPSATTLVRRAGRYSMFHTPPTVDQLRPVGHSVVTFNISSTDGSFTAVGKMADGNAYTHNSVMGAAGEIQLYAGFYPTATPGSLTGTLTVNEVADTLGGYLRNTVTGDLQWNKPNQGSSSSDRIYKAGFQGQLLTLTGSTAGKPNGGLYVPPSSGATSTPLNEYPRFYMGMNATGNNNGKFSFSKLGVDLIDARVTQLNDVFSVPEVPAGQSPTVGIGPGSPFTQITVDATTGMFSGTFTITDQDPFNSAGNVDRNGTFFGVVVRDNVSSSSAALWFGRGAFLLPRLPEASLPPTNLTNSPIQSGALQMLRNP